MQELKKDYQAGNISEDKYRYLSNEYSKRLTNLDATNRIRNMQGRQVRRSPSRATQRSMAEASRREDKALVDKYVVKPKQKQMPQQKSEISNKSKYAILVVVCLIGAFLVGISFGLFTGGPQASVPLVSVLIDDSAFPEVIANVTNTTGTDNSVSNTNDLNNTTTGSGNGSSTNGGSGNGSGTGGSGTGGGTGGSGTGGTGGSGTGGSGTGGTGGSGTGGSGTGGTGTGS